MISPTTPDNEKFRQKAADRYGNEGTGIGLATVKKVVTSLGGTVSVASEVGSGTTFNFSISKL